LGDLEARKSAILPGDERGPNAVRSRSMILESLRKDLPAEEGVGAGQAYPETKDVDGSGTRSASSIPRATVGPFIRPKTVPVKSKTIKRMLTGHSPPPPGPRAKGAGLHTMAGAGAQKAVSHMAGCSGQAALALWVFNSAATRTPSSLLERKYI